MRLLFIFFAFGLAACASNNSGVVPVTSSNEMKGLQSELNDTRSRASTLEREVETRDSTITKLERELAELSLSSENTGSRPAGPADLFPPAAKAGECYARILTPEKYRTISERVLAKQASERVEVIPAEFETVTERVLVKEESKRLELVPAKYEQVTEQVLVSPASSKIVQVPAKYKTVTERVLDKPAYTVWKKGPPSQFGQNVVSQSVSGTGEVMCLVEVPATYKSITKRVVEEPASTQEIAIPAEYKTVTRTVMVEPPTTREIVIPAEYDTVTVRKLVRKAQEKRIAIPEEYQNVTRTEKVADARMDWQQVLCQVNATPDKIRELQNALQKAGYSTGGADGVLGGNTFGAVASFAKARNIPYGDNYVPVEVLKALKVSY